MTKRVRKIAGIAMGLTLTSALSVSKPLTAQTCPTYRLQTQTIYEPVQVQAMKMVYEDTWEDREVVSYRPVIKETREKRSFTVRKPVVETSTINETYTVLKPVYKTEYVDQSYYQTEYVNETSQREETVISYRPVIETQYQTQHVVVQRPVTETAYQTQNYLTYQPVTTAQTSYVDQGSYVAQQYYRPGDTRYHLRWSGGGYQVDPITGQPTWRRAGLGWTPYTSPGQNFAQLAYQPNIVPVTVPQTSYMPQVVQQQVPYTYTRMENQLVQQNVPIQVQKLQPVQEKRTVPVTTQKPVTRLVENKVPVQKVEWVQEQHVRPVSVQRESYKLETVEQEVPVRTYETERVVQKVRVPVRVARQVPITETRLMPKTVTMRVPLAYYDPYSSSIADSYSSWMPILSDPVVVPGNSSTAAPPKTSPDSGKSDVSAFKPETKEKGELQGVDIEPQDEKKPSEDSTEQEKMPPPEGLNFGGSGLRNSTQD